MRNLLLTALFATVTLPAFAATTWNVDPTISKLTWSVPFNHQPVDGEFKKWDAKISFDPADLPSSSFVVTIDLTSVNSQDANRDGTLKGPDFFNTAATPTATYTATKIIKTGQPGSNTYVAQGMMSLAGVTKPMALPFSVTITGTKANAQGTIHMSRNAFYVGKGQWQSTSEVADLVTVSFTVNATVATPAPVAQPVTQ